MVEDEDGFLWLAGDGGVVRVIAHAAADSLCQVDYHLFQHDGWLTRALHDDRCLAGLQRLPSSHPPNDASVERRRTEIPGADK